MGCQCSKNAADSYINLENLIETPSNPNPNSCLCLTEYTNTMFKLINKIRKNPPAFADLVEKATKYITKENERLIFSYKLKVALSKGEEVFKQVAEELRQMTPMTPFEFRDDIVIEVPSEEEELKDIKVFMNKVLEKKKSCSLASYFKDAIKDPEIAILMIIIDDTEKNSGKKRAAVLNKDFKYIGISSILEGNTFCAYYTFSK